MTVSIIVGMILLALFAGSFFLPNKTSKTFGSARFDQRSKLLKRKNKGFRIGKKNLLLKESCNHVLLCGPSGSGKTSKILLETCFDQLKKNNNLIVLDPKLELSSLISGYAKHKLNYNVYVLNILEPNKSITWNPLASVQEQNFYGLISDMYEITNTGTTTESIWWINTIEILVLLCTVLATVDDGIFLNLSNLYFLLQQLQADPKETSQWLEQQNVDAMTKLSIKRFISQDDKVFSGILSGANSVVKAFIPNELAPLTSSTTLPSITDFRTQKSLLILSLPIGNEQVYQPYISLLTKYIFDNIIQTPATSKDRYLACFMEEFGQVFIPNYASIVSTVRQRKVMLYHCLQNLDQLILKYKSQTAHIIANNCSHWILLPAIKSQTTLTYIRDSLLGTSTASGNEREIGRSLLTSDEIRRLPDNTALLISSNLQPVLIKLKALYKSWCKKRRYGLKNIDGQLVSKYPLVEHVDSTIEIEYISLNDVPKKGAEDISMIGFKERLEQVLKGELEK